MKIEKMTRALLRSIPLGETRTFKLPNAAACDTAKTVAYQLQHIEGVNYKAKTDYANATIEISKEALI